MGFQDDWIMRQIEMMAKFVGNVIFGKKEGEVQYEIIGDINDTSTLTPTDMLHWQTSSRISSSFLALR